MNNLNKLCFIRKIVGNYRTIQCQIAMIIAIIDLFHVRFIIYKYSLDATDTNLHCYLCHIHAHVYDEFNNNKLIKNTIAFSQWNELT